MRPIFVRKLSNNEKTAVKELLKSSNTRLYKRARVIWLSGIQRLKVAEIAKIVDLHFINVRIWIRRFNKDGLNSLKPRFSSGRPRHIKQKQREKIVRLLKTKPGAFGLAWSSWSLRALCQIAVKIRIVKTISPEYMRRIIAEEGYSYKRSKRWINSPDPEYEVKKTVSRGRLGLWTRVVR